MFYVFLYSFSECIKFSQKKAPKRKNLFVTGCTSYKSESVTLHEKSDYHKRAHESANIKPGETPGDVMLRNLNKEALEKLTHMFRTVHALAKNNRPLTDFLWICDLDEAKGLNIGSTYRNNMQAATFLDFVAMDAFNEVADTLQFSRFLSIMGDDSTDVASVEQSMWFMRTCSGGNVQLKFIGSTPLDKADATSIVNGVKKLVSQNLDCDWEPFTQKMVACTTDGASVMLGKKTGVVTQFQKEQPCLLPVHCMAHRTELSYGDAFKNTPLYDKAVKTLLVGLFYFYAKSPLNRSNLRRGAAALDDSVVQAINIRGSRSGGNVEEMDHDQQDAATSASLTPGKGAKRVLIPTRPGGTRWVQHTVRAITNLTKSYRAIVLHMTQVS